MTKPLDTAPDEATSHRLREIRLEKLEKLRALGVDPYPYRFDIFRRAA